TTSHTRHAASGGGARGSTANRKEHRQTRGSRGAATVFMERLYVVAEFEHLAEHGDLSLATVLVRDDIERATKRTRTRVVRIVDERDTATEARDCPPAIR